MVEIIRATDSQVTSGCPGTAKIDFKEAFSDLDLDFEGVEDDLDKRFHQIREVNKAKQVIKSLTTIEFTSPTVDGSWFSVRIMPYRTLDDRIDGLVVTFTDITVAKKLEIELKMANAFPDTFKPKV